MTKEELLLLRHLLSKFETYWQPIHDSIAPIVKWTDRDSWYCSYQDIFIAVNDKVLQAQKLLNE